MYVDKAILPQQIWTADLASPVSADRTHVVISKSIGWDVNLAVYDVVLTQSLGMFPIELVPNKYREWPKPASPASQMSKTLVDKIISGISRINVIVDRDYLLIFGKREDELTSPVFIRFNLKTKQWAELTLASQPGSDGAAEKKYKERMFRTRSSLDKLRCVACVLLGCMAAVSDCFAQLNENCVVSILNRTVFGLVRARATCVNNGVTIFGQSDLITIQATRMNAIPPIQLGSTTPIPTGITVSGPLTSLTSSGETVQVSVMASYASGNPQDVSAASSGTIYNNSNPFIATVSAGGLVTAVSSGTVVIQAVNEGRQGIVSLQVVLAGASHGGIPDDWAITHGLDPTDPAMPDEDPDHDGLTNLQEFQNGTDPRNPDTDGD
ncbi:MAG: hypothetical protein DMG21_01240, partial [Acidobacteria bacterium]